MLFGVKSGPAYTYVWEFRVDTDRVDEFVRAYGPEGDWVRLFRRAAGYVGTELLRDLEDPNRFVTIDSWESEEAWAAFLKTFARDFEELDARCEELTSREAPLGRFARE